MIKLSSIWLVAASAAALIAAGCLPPASRSQPIGASNRKAKLPALNATVVAKKTNPKLEGFSADQLIDRLDSEFAKRFDNISNDYFGDDRIPIKYHIHAGVLNPDWFREVEADDPLLKSTPDNLPTEDEQNLIHAVDHKGYYLEVYTLGKQDRFRGPIGDDDVEPTLLGNKLLSLSKNLLKGKGALTAKGSDDHVQFKLVAIRSTGESCNACHQDTKTGDRIGVMIYRYWPQAAGDFSAASLQKKSDINRSLG